MKKDSDKNNFTGKLLTVTVLVVLGFFVIALIMVNNKDYYFGNDEEEYFQSVQRSHNIDKFMDMLYIQGEYYFDDDKRIIFTSFNQYNGKLIEDVTLYNAFYKPKHKLTADQLNEEFEKFCQNTEDPEILYYFDDSLEEIEKKCAKVGIDLETYGIHKIVTKQLDDYGTNIYDATEEQWYKASEYAATKLGVDIICKKLERVYGNNFTISY